MAQIKEWLGTNHFSGLLSTYSKIKMFLFKKTEFVFAEG